MHWPSSSTCWEITSRSAAADGWEGLHTQGAQSHTRLLKKSTVASHTCPPKMKPETDWAEQPWPHYSSNSPKYTNAYKLYALNTLLHKDRFLLIIEQCRIKSVEEKNSINLTFVNHQSEEETLQYHCNWQQHVIKWTQQNINWHINNISEDSKWKSHTLAQIT